MVYNEHKIILTIIEAYVHLNPKEEGKYSPIIEGMRNLPHLCNDCTTTETCAYHSKLYSEVYNSFTNTSLVAHADKLKFISYVPDVCYDLQKIRNFFMSRFNVFIPPFNLESSKLICAPVEHSIGGSVDLLSKLSYYEILRASDLYIYNSTNGLMVDMLLGTSGQQEVARKVYTELFNCHESLLKSADLPSVYAQLSMDDTFYISKPRTTKRVAFNELKAQCAQGAEENPVFVLGSTLGYEQFDFINNFFVEFETVKYATKLGV